MSKAPNHGVIDAIMARPRVYVHRSGPWHALFMDARNCAAIERFADVIVEPDASAGRPARYFIERLRGCSAILSLNGYGADELTPEVLAAVPSVRVICIAHSWGQFAGAAQRPGMSVVEGSNAGTVAVAEWIVTAALMGRRRLHDFDAELKAGSAWGEPRRRTGLLSGALVGILGLGRIGRYCARLFQALGAEVVATSTSCTDALAAGLGVRLVTKEELLASAQVIALCHQLLPATRGMLGARDFARIRDGCVFVNAARAGLCDERALVDALAGGRFTAYLDVFDSEPLPPLHPFRSLPNVVITPHIAGNNAAMFLRCARDAIDTLEGYFAGRGLVDRRYAYP